MSNFAPPIERDGWVYHGVLHADVGNLNRHPRATRDELTALLRPKKQLATQQKDQVGHWYFAQLKHYGLPSTKDKNTAKVRLLDALNNGKLEVPNEVKKIEASLKKEYDMANRKSKSSMKSEGDVTKTGCPTKKRKRNEEGSGTLTATPAKKTKAANEGKATAREKTAEKAKAAAKPKPQVERPTFTTKQTKSTATKRAPASKSSSQQPFTQHRSSDTSAKKELASRKKPAPKKEPGANKMFSVMREPTTDGPTALWKGGPPNGQKIDQITGIYDISCPVIERTRPHLRDNLRMILCYDESDNGCTWGSFSWGSFFGIIKMSPGPLNFGPKECSFGWRVRNSETQEAKFGRGCFGALTFFTPGEIAGQLYGLDEGELEFTGVRRPGPKNCGHPPSHFEEEWLSFPAEVYRSDDDDPNSDSGYDQESDRMSIDGDHYHEASDYDQGWDDDQASGYDYEQASDYDHEDGSYGYDSLDEDAEQDVGSDSDIGQICGVYDVEVPTIEGGWSQYSQPNRMSLLLDEANNRVWGSFDWGPFWGIIQLNPGPSRFSGYEVSLGWRANEHNNHNPRFGRGCTGYIVFPQVGEIFGELKGLYGNVKFSGQRRTGPRIASVSKPVSWFQSEWKRIADSAYDPRAKGW